MVHTYPRISCLPAPGESRCPIRFQVTVTGSWDGGYARSPVIPPPRIVSQLVTVMMRPWDPDAAAGEVVDRAALVAFNDATGGNRSLWVTTAPLDLWESVALGGNGRVQRLGPFENSSPLVGTIPAEIENLTDLRHLNLWPAESLTGILPAEVGNLTNLQSLDLRATSLTGSLPAEMGNLTLLTVLRVEDTSSSRGLGAIPVQMGNLRLLVSLTLNGAFTGQIPIQLGNLTRLRRLVAINNRFPSPIPAELGKLISLWQLILGNNQLSGTIPEQLGDLTNLTQLDLSGNQLTGAIPSQLGNLTNLTHLDLSGNQLIGTIPEPLCARERSGELLLSVDSEVSDCP